jgi:hypothetical protein
VKFESCPVKLCVSGVEKTVSVKDFGDRDTLECIR